MENSVLLRLQVSASDFPDFPAKMVTKNVNQYHVMPNRRPIGLLT